MPQKLYSRLASLVLAIRNCESSKNFHWRNVHAENLHKLVQEHMPQGSGFDQGTTLDVDASNDNRLVFHTSFHHMNETGFYDGWTQHVVTVSASLAFGVTVRVSGRNRNDIKTYICECFGALAEVETDI